MLLLLQGRQELEASLKNSYETGRRAEGLEAVAENSASSFIELFHPEQHDSAPDLLAMRVNNKVAGSTLDFDLVPGGLNTRQRADQLACPARRVQMAVARPKP